MLIKNQKISKINNMKTLKNSKNGEIKRLNDKEAEKLVRQTFLGWGYVPKELWKQESRTKTKSEKNEESVDTRSGKKVDGKTKKSTSR
jgi:hypothetical protein